MKNTPPAPTSVESFLTDALNKMAERDAKKERPVHDDSIVYPFVVEFEFNGDEIKERISDEREMMNSFFAGENPPTYGSLKTWDDLGRAIRGNFPDHKIIAFTYNPPLPCQK